MAESRKSSSSSRAAANKPQASSSESIKSSAKATSTARRSRTRAAAAAYTPRAVRRPVNGFVDFLREHAIVGLAVGFVLGTQVQTVVKQLISSFIDPLFKLILPGDKTLSARTFTLHFDGRHANFGWGAVVYALIDFIFVAVAIYAIIKMFKLDKLDKKK